MLLHSSPCCLKHIHTAPQLNSKFRFRDPTDHSTIVELRGRARDGIGQQTVVPPSIHESGERIEFAPGGNGTPENIDAERLVRAASCIAAGALLVRYWPKQGTRLDTFLALAGSLARANWRTDDAVAFHQAIYRGVWGSAADLRAARREVESTFERLSGGQNVTGIPHLAQCIDKRVVEAALGWLGVDTRRDAAHIPEPKGKLQGPSQARRLLRLVEDVELFRCDEKAYASTEVGSHRETHLVRSACFRTYLQQRYYRATRQAIHSNAIQDALGVLEGRALEGEQDRVYCRLGESNGNIYLDLGDSYWAAVEIRSDGWSVRQYPPVKFRRPRGMLRMPLPRHDEQAAESLKRFFNLEDSTQDHKLKLILAWLVAGFRPKGPYPILVLNSQHGSGKSTTSHFLRGLLDPNVAALRPQPKDHADLMLWASNSRMIALDNLSHLPDWLSDGLCRLSTGAAFSTRQFYTNQDEVLFCSELPVLVNGIEEIATRGDLLDRSIIIELPEIPSNKRKTEKELWTDFEQCRPGILGYLLSAVSGALARIDTVQLHSPPRMADFAHWIVAAEPSLGWKEGEFLDLYGQNRSEATHLTLEASPIGRYILTFMTKQSEWIGTATELLSALVNVASEPDPERKGWPKNARGLSNALRRIVPALKAIGIAVTFERPHHCRLIGLRRTCNEGCAGSATQKYD